MLGPLHLGHLPKRRSLDRRWFPVFLGAFLLGRSKRRPACWSTATLGSTAVVAVLGRGGGGGLGVGVGVDGVDKPAKVAFFRAVGHRFGHRTTVFYREELHSSSSGGGVRTNPCITEFQANKLLHSRTPVACLIIFLRRSKTESYVEILAEDERLERRGTCWRAKTKMTPFPAARPPPCVSLHDITVQSNRDYFVPSPVPSSGPPPPSQHLQQNYRSRPPAAMRPNRLLLLPLLRLHAAHLRSNLILQSGKVGAQDADLLPRPSAEERRHHAERESEPCRGVHHEGLVAALHVVKPSQLGDGLHVLLDLSRQGLGNYHRRRQKNKNWGREKAFMRSHMWRW